MWCSLAKAKKRGVRFKQPHRGLKLKLIHLQLWYHDTHLQTIKNELTKK